MIKKEKGKKVLLDWALDHGFAMDSWGNLKREKDGKIQRIKMNPNKARWEAKTSGGWVRIYSGAYKDFCLTEDGKLSGMRRGY